jgi:hypothetical protein
VVVTAGGDGSDGFNGMDGLYPGRRVIGMSPGVSLAGLVVGLSIIVQFSRCDLVLPLPS